MESSGLARSESDGLGARINNLYISSVSYKLVE